MVGGAVHGERTFQWEAELAAQTPAQWWVGGDETECEVGVGDVDRERERGEQVLGLSGEATPGVETARADQLRAHLELEVDEELAVAPAQLGDVVEFAEAFLAVLADRLQKPVPRLEASVVGDHQRLRHQPVGQLPHRRHADRPARAHRFGGLQETVTRANRRCAAESSRS
jgi:hypothetical protein